MDVIQDTSARTTATSAAEGRLKVGVNEKKKKFLHKAVTDGKGGPGYKYKKDSKGGPGNPLADPTASGLGMPNPSGAPSLGGPQVSPAGPAPTAPSPSSMMPLPGTQITPNSFTPQQQMQMAMQGMAPAGASSGSPMKPPYASKIANRPHRSSRGLSAPHPRGAKRMALKGMIAHMKKAPKAPTGRRVGF